MRELYTLDKNLLSSIKNNLTDEYTNFKYNSYKYFSNSYICQCQDSTIKTMETKLESLYTKIDKGYNNINNWIETYINDSDSLEKSLVNAKPSGISDSATSLLVNKVSGKNNANVKEASPLKSIFLNVINTVSNMVEELNQQAVDKITSNVVGSEIKISYNDSVNAEIVDCQSIIATNNKNIALIDEYLRYNTDILFFDNSNYVEPEYITELREKYKDYCNEIKDTNNSSCTFEQYLVITKSKLGLEILSCNLKINSIKEKMLLNECYGDEYLYDNSDYLYHTIPEPNFTSPYIRELLSDKNGNFDESKYEQILATNTASGPVDFSANIILIRNKETNKVEMVINKRYGLYIKYDYDTNKLTYIKVDYDENSNRVTSRNEYEIKNIDLSKTLYEPSIRDVDGVMIYDKYGNSVKYFEIKSGTLDNYSSDHVYDKVSNNYSYYIKTDTLDKIKEKYPNKDEKWYLYYAKIMCNKYNYLIEGKSNDEIEKMVDELIAKDASNNNRILHSTPILCSGKYEWCSVTPGEKFYEYEGDYLQYYNDVTVNSGLAITDPYARDKILNFLPEEETIKIRTTAPLAEAHLDSNGVTTMHDMDKTEIREYVYNLNRFNADINDQLAQYDDYYKSKTLGYLNDLSYIKFDDTSDPNYKDFAAYCSQVYSYRKSSYIVMETSLLDKDYDFLVGSVTHELGHAFNNSTGLLFDHNDSDEWSTIYNQVKKADPNNQFLRSYAFYSRYECFAEAIHEYYGENDNMDYTNPNDLKAIPINYEGYTNLYDYIDDIVKGKRVY